MSPRRHGDAFGTFCQKQPKNNMDIFTAIYFLALVIEIIIRAPLNKRRRQEKMSERRITNQEMLILSLLLLGGFIMPLIYAATNWLDFANYTLPMWAGWLGVLLLAGAIFIFWRAHADLGLNWSPTLEIREKHELITRGIYGIIRHPMYASQWLLAIAQPLLLQNWIAGFLNLLAFIPFYVLRVKAEEQMMLDSFGAQYQEYMKKTGRVLPKM
jgi:protein-S-isoprenylcysteine O-methyltransferase Ste14